MAGCEAAETESARLPVISNCEPTPKARNSLVIVRAIEIVVHTRKKTCQDDTLAMHRTELQAIRESGEQKAEKKEFDLLT